MAHQINKQLLLAALIGSVTLTQAPAVLAAAAEEAGAALSAVPTNTGKVTADRAFEQFKQQFLSALWKQDPDLAMSAGKFEDAGKLAIPDQAGRDASLAFASRWQQRLGKVARDQLSQNEQTDYVLIQNYLSGIGFYLQQLREYQWNPSVHNIATGFDAILNTEFAPKKQRLQLALARLQGVPAYYAAAMASVHLPSLEHTQLAIRQSAGALEVLGQLEHAAADAGLSKTDQQLLTRRLAAARQAVNDYVGFLHQQEADYRPQTGHSFRIGKALYEGKFKADIQSDLSAEQTYQRALAAKQEAHQRMEQLADQLWGKVMGQQAKPENRLEKIAMVIDKLSEQHIQPQQLYQTIRQQLPVLEQWIQQHDLLTLDTKKPLVVRETPEYERGIAIASIEAPGIFRPHDNTYYNVTPFDGQSAAQIESTLREYNHWVLQILSIHEAIPGHYTQLQHANQSPSVIKTLFGNGAMIEGWAVYSERMMLESGYGGNEPEMWLMYYKWNLRAVCNTILDYQVHTMGMSEAEAKDFLIHQAFQTEAEANGKWQRVQYTSVQLASYFSGYSEILDFRNQLKQELGARFNLKRFHEKFLSYGSAPVGQIKQMMRHDLARTGQL